MIGSLTLGLEAMCLLQFKFVAMIEVQPLVRQSLHFRQGLVAEAQGLGVELRRGQLGRFRSHHRARRPLGQFQWRFLFQVEWPTR